MKYIWSGMIILGILFSFFNGTIHETSMAIVQGATEAIQLCITIGAAICLWSGFMEIVKKTNALKYIDKVMNFVLKHTMPEIHRNKEASKAVSANLTANFLGLGNAATPLGIQAIKEMKKANQNKEHITWSMIMLIVINSSCIQLLPMNLIMIREAAGSENAASIILPVWFASTCSTISGIIMVLMIKYMKRKEDHK